MASLSVAIWLSDQANTVGVKIIFTRPCCLIQVVVAGHIWALYSHALAERQGHTPGATPIRKRTVSSQSQFNPDPSLTASSVTFAQERIEKELMEKLFA